MSEDLDNPEVEFEVSGIPSPGGSKRYVGHSKKGHAILIDMGGQRTKDWRAAVYWAAIAAKIPALEGPLALTVVFRMPRPKCHFHSSKKKAGQLREDAPVWHTHAPDVTKLLRSTEDSLKGVAWLDDSQICQQSAYKLYADNPGAKIRIARIITP